MRKVVYFTILFIVLANITSCESINILSSKPPAKYSKKPQFNKSLIKLLKSSKCNPPIAPSIQEKSPIIEQVKPITPELIQSYKTEFMQEFSAQYNPNSSQAEILSTVIQNISYTSTPSIKNASQLESTLNFTSYFSKIASQERQQLALQFLQQNLTILNQVEQYYGVDKEVIVALMMVETQFGKTLGKHNLSDALFSLSIEGTRKSYFKKEFFNWLKLIVFHNQNPQTQGSWAGASGLVQFMPYTFLQFAVDFDQDGKIDLINSKADAIASAANYLYAIGWQKNLPIILPAQNVMLPINCDALSQPATSDILDISVLQYSSNTSSCNKSNTSSGECLTNPNISTTLKTKTPVVDQSNPLVVIPPVIVPDINLPNKTSQSAVLNKSQCSLDTSHGVCNKSNNSEILNELSPIPTVTTLPKLQSENLQCVATSLECKAVSPISTEEAVTSNTNQQPQTITISTESTSISKQTIFSSAMLKTLNPPVPQQLSPIISTQQMEVLSSRLNDQEHPILVIPSCNKPGDNPVIQALQNPNISGSANPQKTSLATPLPNCNPSQTEEILARNITPSNITPSLPVATPTPKVVAPLMHIPSSLIPNLLERPARDLYLMQPDKLPTSTELYYVDDNFLRLLDWNRSLLFASTVAITANNLKAKNQIFPQYHEVTEVYCDSTPTAPQCNQLQISIDITPQTSVLSNKMIESLPQQKNYE